MYPSGHKFLSLLVWTELTPSPSLNNVRACSISRIEGEQKIGIFPHGIFDMSFFDLFHDQTPTLLASGRQRK